MRFECFNKRAQAGEVAYERLILTAGQVPAAQKAARAMGGNDWAATCACHGTRYNISLLDSTLRVGGCNIGESGGPRVRAHTCTHTCMHV